MRSSLRPEGVLPRPVARHLIKDNALLAAFAGIIHENLISGVFFLPFLSVLLQTVATLNTKGGGLVVLPEGLQSSLVSYMYT